MEDTQFAELRRHMIADIAAKTIFACGQLDKAALAPRTLKALDTVPRHEFVPSELQPFAYADSPLPIGFDKTISQPFIVAVMTDLLDLQASDVVLEVGTGLGYQTAVLATLARQVYSVELISGLAAQARLRLARLGHRNVEVRVANGWRGWPAHAPFDKIIVTAAPDHIPPRLVDQLKTGGKMVLPTGAPDDQRLLLLEKRADGMTNSREVFAVRFSLMLDSEPD
jgi:protein-L-isoaspartate(D-aspartate) O-methyltransferase